jgi:uncharacterized protein YoaH (UPF0181 family)
MERTIKISYNWSRDEGDGEVLEHHQKYLEEAAFERITEMMNEGMYCGELSDNIHAVEDPEDHEGTPYSGWWKVEKD